ncbi:hypothetical protein F7725_004671 [Dissostichus mawsoni]|uniref:Uncharacterized protein n=1 Tax=Dissostichus mawsoni TaxID=36200 RepID=A0A7J5XKU2_DISMA|nr:hypothetical protein F7725_004671 [Dissostichus mawsoni]
MNSQWMAMTCSRSRQKLVGERPPLAVAGQVLGLRLGGRGLISPPLRQYRVYCCGSDTAKVEAHSWANAWLVSPALHCNVRTALRSPSWNSIRTHRCREGEKKS